MPSSDACWSLVTGASSGLGMELARQLAAQGTDVVLTARSAEPMETLAAELRARHGVNVEVQPIDLGRPGSAAELKRRLDARAIAPDILINNAAFGISDRFVDQEPDRLAAMLQLNIVSLTELAHAFGRQMSANRRGHILLVASMAAYLPTPMLATYGASKAYVLSLGEALNVELGGEVGVTVLSPGLMDTGFASASGYQAPKSAYENVLPPAAVAKIGLEAMFAGKSSIVAGHSNRIMALATRFVSRHHLARSVLRMAR
ncbi:SDR family oxidoreductase [Phenylobacterium sp.]|uniref:SDR family NAD(P)-dependent oxidoreductase n=1 Tax=Phenylobacterium sp. TaxID=1871053 RepID=UPI00301D69CA